MPRILYYIALSLLFIATSCNRCKEGCVNGQCIQRTCDCDQWYAGDRCDRSQLTVFAGYYRGQTTTDSSRFSVGFNVVPTDTVNMLYADSLSLRLVFEDETRFQVPEQEVFGKVMQGEGQVLVDLFSIRLEPVNGDPMDQTLIEATRH